MADKGSLFSPVLQFMQHILVEQWKIRYHCSVCLKYLRWYIFLEFLLWELTAYAGLTWTETNPKNSHFPVTSAFLDIPMQNSMSQQQIIIMMWDCISTYIPLQSPSSSFYVWYHHFPSSGLTKQFISLSLLFVHNKTQSTEAKKKLENKSKELILSHIHVAHTIKTKKSQRRITMLFLLSICQA